MNKIEHTEFDWTARHPNAHELNLGSGRVIWITGLSGSGKTTVAIELSKLISSRGFKPILLDGDNMRQKLFESIIPENDYGNDSRKKFSMAYSRLSLLLASQGFVVITSVIAMFNEIFRWNRSNLPGYLEVYLRTPIKELQKRDSKGLYSEFKKKRIRNVAGLDLKKEEPKIPDLTIDHRANFSATKKAHAIMNFLIETHYFSLSSK